VSRGTIPVMAKDRASLGGPARARRVARPKTLEDLVAATKATVIAEVNELSKARGWDREEPFWSDAQERHLRAQLELWSMPAEEREADELLARLNETLLAAEAFLARAAPSDRGPVADLRGVMKPMRVAGHGLLARAPGLGGVAGAGKTPATPDPTTASRVMISQVFRFARGKWWFGPKGATPRDLALVSILVGNFPKRVKDGFAEKTRFTPAEVIDQEAQDFRAIRRNLRVRRP